MLVLVAFGVLAFLPIPGVSYMTGYYNTHAINLSRQGKLKEAIAFWEKSSKLNKPYSAYADLSLARVYLKKNRITMAWDYANLIPADSFAAAAKYDLEGDLYRKQKSFGRAITAYEKSLGINSGGLRVWQKLIRLEWRTDREKADKDRKKMKYISSFY